jgi:hypothetical protein
MRKGKEGPLYTFLIFYHPFFMHLYIETHIGSFLPDLFTTS